MRHARSVSGAALSALLVIACKDSGGGPSGPPAGITASVEVTPAQATLTAIGATQQLTATVRDGRGTVLAGKSLTWTSSSAAVASVDAGGLVTATGNGTVTISAAVDGKVGQATMTVAQAVARLVVLMPSPLRWTAGEGFTVTVSARDANNAQVDSFGGEVTLSLVSPPSGVLLRGTTRLNASAGRAVFPGLAVDKVGTAYQVTAASGALPAIAGTSFDIVPGPVAQLVFTTQPPATIEAYVPIASGLVVEQRDAYGNVVSGGSISLRLANAPYQGTRLLGTLSMPAAAGTATFGGLQVDRPGAGYRLEAFVGTVTGRSTSFSVSATLFSVATGGTNTQGSGFSCATGTAATWCWGANGDGQLGTPRAAFQENVPIAVDAPAAFVQVTAGTAHACGLTATGEVWCWGAGTAGQLGNGATQGSAVPVRVNASGPTGGRIYTDITAGDQHTCGLVATAVYCWGLNTFGQLGSGSTAPSATPMRITGTGVAPLDFTRLSAGRIHTCGVTSSAAAWCWGAAFNGALGDGQEATHRLAPIQVAGSGTAPLRFGSITAGSSRTCALTVNLSPQRIYCWGLNAAGYLGTGTSDGSVLTATVIPSAADFTAVTSGSSTTCASTATNAIWCWGRGLSGEIGNGALADQSTPALVSTPPGGLARLSAGGTGVCGVRVGGGGVYCWGDNSSGGVGDGTNTTRSVPTRVIQ